MPLYYNTYLFANQVKTTNDIPLLCNGYLIFRLVYKIKYFKEYEIIKNSEIFANAKMKWNLYRKLQSVFLIRKIFQNLIISLIPLSINFIEKALI